MNKQLVKIRAAYDAAADRYFDPHRCQTQAAADALTLAWRRLNAFLIHLAAKADRERKAFRQCFLAMECVWQIWATKCMVKEPWKAEYGLGK
mgnify:CR=1 FL=1